ncbi:beta-1,4 N-acetylgalactosaminyltransferase 1-like [Saccoglossus kowalevskii]|uniref:Beta-1,4 N-acetylgalactosaminyltransferase 1-like n=1 Tax=Saccoglossus kowalevskii TaxID=10224 RepID=A0ABM0GUS0_SACKO|nr:PREDICTED: beta-1,4 N-acetylgalactosaminyltransferase 1-like [Saccoglossus kowalevskii]
MRLSWILKSVLRSSIFVFLCLNCVRYLINLANGNECSERHVRGNDDVDPISKCQHFFNKWIKDSQRSSRVNPTEGTANPTKMCYCTRGSYGPLDYVSSGRRKEIVQKTNQIRKLSKEPEVHCDAMSPLGYMASGLSVEPLGMVTIRGLSIHPSMSYALSNTYYTISFRVKRSLGTLQLHIPEQFDNMIEVDGEDTGLLRLNSSLSVGSMNQLLSNLSYHSNVFTVDDRDVIEVTFLHVTVHINLLIRRDPFPKLYEWESDVSENLNKKITVVTKTFLRYDSVNQLVASVNKYYPNMTIIVADDNESPRPIKGRNVKHIKMPYKEGWFAGRNIGLSLVATEYFFYVDDDMVFTENTKLDKLLTRMQSHPTLDVLGGRTESRDGNLDDSVFAPAIYLRNNSNSGFCLYRRHPRHYHSPSGMPQCYFADEIGNIFMAKTARVREVGFDPIIDRIGHMEFYYDALGRLRIAVCDDVTLYHDRIRTREYVQHRYTDGIGSKEGYHHRMLYSVFKNNMKCLGGVKYIPHKKTA